MRGGFFEEVAEKDLCRDRYEVLLVNGAIGVDSSSFTLHL